jgi:hypothetical protein
MKLRPIFLCAAAAAMVLTAAAAQAFTFDSQTSDDNAVNALAPGVTPYGDPSDHLESSKAKGRFDSEGTTVYREGNMSLQFGQPRNFNQDFNPDPLYDPLRR